MAHSAENMSARAPAEPGPSSGKRILIIEDDASITLGLRLNLEAEGYRVDVADDGEAGLAKARLREADLIILDVMLPKLNGFEVLRQLRSEGIDVPTIVLSARTAELDIVMGLDVGAEDYVTKPFGLLELLARIKTVLRRPSHKAEAAGLPPQLERVESAPEKPASAVIQVGELEIDPRTRQVLRTSVPVTLTATEFDILCCLLKAEGRVLSREEIQDQVWGPEHHGTLRTIDNFMMQLRTKLERDPAEPKHLLTVRGVGYRLER